MVDYLSSLTTEKSAEITLENGVKWNISGQDREAAKIVSRLSEIMNLQPNKGNADKYLIIRTGTNEKGLTARFENNNTVVCTLNPFNDPDMSIVNIIWLSLIIVKDAHIDGGLLLHGALAEYKGSGVIMAGPGGVGKTTASNKLCSPWKALSDDCTLVVCTKKKEYLAHPWPTWSKFLFGGKGGSWNVEHNVKLQAIFFLSRIPAKKPVPISSSEAVSMMLRSSEQAWGQMLNRMGKNEAVKIRIQIFNNICRPVKNIPCYILSLHGNFQEQMEQTIENNCE